MYYGFVQPMSVQELWHWVHVCYGEELGLTSDDEDYVPPSLDESKISSKLASQEFSEVGVFFLVCLFTLRMRGKTHLAIKPVVQPTVLEGSSIRE